MVGTKKRVIRGGQFVNVLADIPHSPSFFYPLPSSAQDYWFLLSHFSSLSLSAFLSCFNLLSFSNPTAASFLPTLPTQSFSCSASLSLLLHRRPYFSCTPSEQPGNCVQDDSGKWRDNPKDFQGFKVFVLAIINCTGCNYHKHTGSENRNKDKHIVLHQFGYFNTQVSTREKHTFWWHEPSNMKILLINTLAP